MIAGRHIVLGVTGGIAAYKAAYLARRLLERGAEVRVVMTPSATEFIGPATFAAITGFHPLVDLFEHEDVSPHTSLARWADGIVVAPATASSIARIAHGESSNALVATVLAATAPVVIAPAMHSEMWEHPATIANIAVLADFGYHIVPPDVGGLAGGDEGVGRLADPDSILDALDDALGRGDLEGLSVLVTAGGTRESIDPVRFIGNRSSGKMGNALAIEAARRGATVTLVTTAEAPVFGGITVIPVETAEQMAEAVWEKAAGCDIAIMAAAVADFRPADPTDHKLHRVDAPPTIELEPTPDILMGLSDRGDVGFLVGFSAEVGSIDRALDKAKKKDVDLLVANDVAEPGSGFGSDTNKVTLVARDGSVTELDLMPKSEVAAAIFSKITDLRDGS
jgi:phosphopantothenoylcysteine decarboxylase / phosphopantothenate---cysteine ligase